ncbi:MAG: c-type cytochrome biogenesis protein CcsB [Candidatus Krumholzibacteria bacterium]|nr:c-type cytochrome biogenesis protein CcsB [Candidatus Krumholzibacteria bacterium]
MSTSDVNLFWLGFWFYLGSFLLFTIFASIRRAKVGFAATALFFVALAFHTAGLAARWLLSTHPPFATMYEYALTMSWIIALAFIFILARFRRVILGVVVSPILVVVLVMTSLLPKEISRQLMPALQSYWFYIHVSLAALAEGAFIVAAGGGVLYLVSSGRGGQKEFLPSKEFLEEIISRSIRIGYPLFTVGALFAGAIWAESAWGSFWSWDPKETGSLVIWLFYTLLLHQNVRGRWGGRTLAILSIAGFVLIVISFLGNLFFGGLHAYI